MTTRNLLTSGYSTLLMSRTRSRMGSDVEPLRSTSSNKSVWSIRLWPDCSRYIGRRTKKASVFLVLLSTSMVRILNEATNPSR